MNYSSRYPLTFFPGDRFWLATSEGRGVHFTVISATENTVELVDSNRHRWDIEYDEDGGHIYPATPPGMAVEFDAQDVQFET